MSTVADGTPPADPSPAGPTSAGASNRSDPGGSAIAGRPVDPVDRLLRLLEVEAVGPDRFRVENPDAGFGERVFGGQVAAQSLRAAATTVEVDHAVHSLHAYFLRPGRVGVPIVYDVERTRDGRSFTTRRVLASQTTDAGTEVIFEVSVSFHGAEEGNEYQLPRASDVPLPAEAGDRLIFIPEEARPHLAMEMKELGPSEADEHGWYPSTRRAWIRIRRQLPDDPIVHQCLLTHLSDMGAVFAAIPPSGDRPWERIMGASLDHAMWFHQPMRADDWFLYDLQALVNAGARGVARGTMHTIDGTLGASMVQEALLRPFDPARRTG
jgi:acyl-CoA thioesterase II